MSAKAEARARAIALMRAPENPSDREIARRVGVANKTVSRWRAQEHIARASHAVGDGIGGPDLHVALTDVGVTAAQFRRWKRAGLLPAPQRRWHGAGSTAIYPLTVVEQAAASKAMVARYRNLDRAALGLLALGWRVCVDRVRGAHLAWITSQRPSLGALEQILTAPADAPWGDAAVAALHTALTTHRGFRTLRNAAPRQPGQRRADAAWDHLVRIAGLFLHGSIGDHETADLLTAFGTRPGNLAEQIHLSRAVQEALSATMLARVAADTDEGEIVEAGDQLAFAYIFFLVLVDGGIAMTTSPQDRPQPLAAHLDADPFVLARMALGLASVKRHPRLGPPLSDWLTDLCEDGTAPVRDMLAYIDTPPPALTALADRYLGVRERLGRLSAQPPHKPPLRRLVDAAFKPAASPVP